MTPYEKMILQAVIDGKTIEQRIPHLSTDKSELWDARPEGLVLECIAKGWAEKHKYFRVAPETIQIGGYTVPKPESVAPAVGADYYVTSLDGDSVFFGISWDGDSFDLLLLARGLVHLTREAAEQHAKALIAISGGTV